uniref:F-box domain-containing protein n=1 Tax=Trichobilharzia regenti TaxID=157069 RepID=A0AA85JI22_TRIRE|nr:unnamed protein product [Trichobilharzia regenti]
MARERKKWELVHQFVYEVVDFSSQYGSESGSCFSAWNIVGPCHVYPNYCDSNCACAFRTYGKWWRNSPSYLQPIGSVPEDVYSSEDYVDLYFDVPVIPVRLQIYETYNPGCVVRVSACYRTQPEDGPVNTRKLQWITLWKAPPLIVNSNHRHNLGGAHQSSNKLQLTYHHLDDTCTTLACPTVNRIRSVSEIFADRYLPAIQYDGNYSFPSHYSEYIAQSRIFQPTLTNVKPYPTDLIRIEFDNTRCRYFTQIDAVRLSGWAELVNTSRWTGIGQLEAPAPITDLSTTSQQPSNNHTHNTLSFFLDLLRPCTPRLTASTYDLTDASIDVSFSDISPGSSSNLLCEEETDENAMSSALIPVNVYRQSSGLCRIPPVGMNALLSSSRSLVALPPGTICRSSLFGLTYLKENALWRHGPLTRLPYEVLLRVFSYLNLRSLFRCACVSRQFRCLVEDTLASMTSLNLQSFWSTLTDPHLLSLGKRLGQVNLTVRAVAEYYTTGNCLVAPITLLRRKAKEEEEEVVVVGRMENEQNHTANQYKVSRYNTNHYKEYNSLQYSNYPAKRRTHTPLAERVRSWSTSAERVRNQARMLDAMYLDVIDNCQPVQDSVNEKDIIHKDLNEKFIDDMITLQQQTDELNHSDHFNLPTSHLRRLDMSWCGNYSQISPTAFGHFLTDACRNLVTLRLSSCKFLNDDCLLHIVNTCPYLKELDLSSCLGITSYGFSTLGRLIHLTWISVYRTFITDSGLSILSELCQHLRHVNIGSCVEVHDMDSVLRELTRNNPNLRSLNLWRCSSLTAAGISSIAEHCQYLEELDVGWCRNIVLTQESSCILRLANGAKRLKKLFLTGTNLLNSEELITLGECLNSTLEQLDIHSSTNITTSAIAIFLKQCQKLKLLDVSFCPEIHAGSLITLRYLFPHCTIIDSIPDMNAEILGNPFPEMIVDEAVDIADDELNRFDQNDNDEVDSDDGNDNIPQRLQGRRELLALPAPNPQLAIAAGPSQSDEQFSS